ncbi:hypothetical protein GCM10025777_28830 [Membranihabitans marinus]
MMTQITHYAIDVIQYFTQSLLHVDTGWPYIFSPQLTCLYLGISIIFIGLYIHKQIFPSWTFYVFLILALFYYSMDCYAIRKSTFIATYEEKDTIIVDLFTGGKLYTNDARNDKIYILKNRKRHYINSQALLSDLFVVDKNIIQIVHTQYDVIDPRANMIIISPQKYQHTPIGPNQHITIVNASTNNGNTRKFRLVNNSSQYLKYSNTKL